MSVLMVKLKDLIRSDRGATTTEYAVILALILAVIIGAISSFGTTVLVTHTNNVSNIL